MPKQELTIFGHNTFTPYIILKRDLALRQQSKKDVMMTNNTKMV